MRGTPRTHPYSSHALGYFSFCLRYNPLLNTLSLFPGCFYQLSGSFFTLRYSLYTQRKSLLIIRSYAFANALFNSLFTHFLLLNLLYSFPTRFFCCSRSAYRIYISFSQRIQLANGSIRPLRFN